MRKGAGGIALFKGINIRKMLSDKTYYKKVFMGMMSAYILAVLAVSVIVFIAGRDLVMSGEKDAAHSAAEHFASWNDSRINSVQSILDTLLYDDDVIKYAITGDRIYMTEIDDKIHTYSAVLSDYYVNMGIIDPARDSSISMSGVNRLDISAITLPDSLDTTHYARSDDSQLVLTNGYSYDGTSFYKSRVYAGDNELIFFYTLYDRSLFDAQISENDRGSYGILHNKELIYVTNDQEDGSKAITEAAQSRDGDGSGGGFMTYKLTSSTDLAFSYVYAVKPPSFAWFYICILLMILVLSFVSVTVVTLMTKSLYSPINDIVVKFKRFNNDSTEKEDVPYVLSKMDSMFEDINKIKQESIRNQSIITDKFFEDWLSGNMSAGRAAKIIQENHYELLTERHTPVSFYIANGDEVVDYYGTEGVPYIKQDIIDILKKSIDSFYIYHDCYVGFVVFIPGDAEPYETIFEQLSDMLETDFNIIVKIFIGNTVSDYSGDVKAYNDILMYREDTFLLDLEKSVYKVGEYEPEGQHAITYSLEMERRLIDDFLHGRRDSAEDMINNMINSNITYNATVSVVNQLQSSFNVTIMRILMYLGKDIEEMYPNREILNFPTIGKDIDTIKQNLFKMFEPLLDSIPKESESESNYDREKISSYIDQNIKNNIGLDDLAQYMNYSSWYTSKIFKNIFNQNFRSYVNMRRVEIAKEMLDNGSKVSEAAAAVGCAHIETFIRIFKKHTGMVPSEYAKRK